MLYADSSLHSLYMQDGTRAEISPTRQVGKIRNMKNLCRTVRYRYGSVRYGTVPLRFLAWRTRVLGKEFAIDRGWLVSMQKTRFFFLGSPAKR